MVRRKVCLCGPLSLVHSLPLDDGGRDVPSHATVASSLPGAGSCNPERLALTASQCRVATPVMGRTRSTTRTASTTTTTAAAAAATIVAATVTIVATSLPCRGSQLLPLLLQPLLLLPAQHGK